MFPGGLEIQVLPKMTLVFFLMFYVESMKQTVFCEFPINLSLLNLSQIFPLNPTPDQKSI